MSAQYYFGYWGKAQQDVPGGWHQLVFHMLDCAAVSAVLLERDDFLLSRLARTSGIAPAELRKVVPFIVACHDVGKFSGGFQSLRADIASMTQPGFRPVGYEARHDAAGWQLWTEVLVRDLPFGVISSDEKLGDPEDVRDLLSPWLRAVTGHHGQPPVSCALQGDALFSSDQKLAASQAVRDLAALFRVGEMRIARAAALEEQLAPSAWLLAGIAVLSDWLGSDTNFFPYLNKPLPLDAYYQKALRAADDALSSSGLLPSTVHPVRPFEDLFGYEPTPLQAVIGASVAIREEEPQLFFIEDTTGSGKTEAAVLLASRLMASGNGDGFFVALPTMATANQMLCRMEQVYAGLFAQESRPSLLLTHGGRRLFERLRRDVNDAGGSAELQCPQWLGDNRKKAFLSTVGVGTVDQALLAVLPSRHNVLRLLGLHRKVLIVDEVHSYDEYMLRVLEVLLEFHASLGGSAILLSATLSESRRRKLGSAFRRGMGSQRPLGDLRKEFPLVTACTSHAVEQIPAGVAPRNRRRVDIAWVTSFEAAIAIVKEKAAEGRAVCWIRNSVDDAIEAFEVLVDASPELARQTTLFHARFMQGDRWRIEQDVISTFGKNSDATHRPGRILIATQVVEQSLDIDFDELVTDLAPIDLIVQRSGRLRRHTRDADGNPIAGPDRRGVPTLHVLAPEWQDDPTEKWVEGALRRTSFVYPDHARLWLTQRVLRERGAIVTPEESRLLIEKVYGEDALDRLPERLESASLKVEGRAAADRGLAALHTLKVSQGYLSEGTAWIEDHAAITRMGEATVTLRLALRSTPCEPLLAAEDCAKTFGDCDETTRWPLCDVSVRRALVARAETGDDSMLLNAKASMPDQGKWSEIVVMEPYNDGFAGRGVREPGDRRVRILYDRIRGLRVEEEHGL